MLMKRIILFFFVMMQAALMSACADVQQETTDDFLLKEFVLVMNEKYYHATLDQETKEGRVGLIEYGSYISDVEYVLASGVTIEPDPKTLLGEWPAEQTFTITDGKVTESWKISLPAFISQVPEVDGMEVVFRDEFDVDGEVNEEYWAHIPPGTAAWQQFLSGKKEYAYIKDGNLVLVCAPNKDDLYVGGGIWTNGKLAIGPGHRFSARIKFVNDQEGVGHAFWLMPYWATQVYEGWPHCGEIDILEHSYAHSYVQQTLHSYYIDIYDPTNNYAGKPVYKSYTVDQYNIYTVDFLENNITFYVNGVATMTYENMHLQDEALLMQWPFNTEFYIILDHHPTKNQYNITGETTMLVDWVRVTKL